MGPALYVAIGYFAGILASFFVMRPTEQYKKAFEAARKQYTNWDEGFTAGWNAALERIQAEFIVKTIEQITQDEENKDE